MRIPARLAGLGMAVVLSGTAACSAGHRPEAAPTTAAYEGTRLPASFRLPDARLTGTDGRPYDLRGRTAGKISMLFFGFTHCPDICPTTMADVSGAMRLLTPAERKQVQVIFISADPARDTPKALKAFLGRFDPSFVGLTGPLKDIHKVAAHAKISLGDPPAHPRGDYVVAHGSQLLTFGPDGGGRLLFSYGTGAGPIARGLKTVIKEDHL
ncbi:MAG: electron transport protein SCO1/SenC [Streptosporangiaceae bacterium]|jgi:protein SCO1/2|nr:electron transport protein SCO1/SenC [Streptosporangiaceae bacterium]